MPLRLGLWEIILILPSLLIYFVPAIVAVIRRPKSLSGIILLNALAGWTFLGWVASLVWAVIAEKKKKPED